jgi:3-oxoacyl-[acyl-carrier-protein] synthase-3
MDSSSPELIRVRRIVEQCVQAGLPAGELLPGEDSDWIEAGALDSMAHVEVLLGIESAFGLPGLFGRCGSAPPVTTRAATELVSQALAAGAHGDSERGTDLELKQDRSRETGGFAGWGAALGSECVSIARVEEELCLSEGTLAKGAGIQSVRRASHEENEILLAKRAAERALQMAGVSAEGMDWIIATSETFLAYPSFSASLHTALLAASTCRLLDVGGACVGLLNCFAVAKALFSDPGVGRILVVSADVHSHRLAAEGVPGEFAGLFGDGASAFVLQRSPPSTSPDAYSIGASIGSCCGTFSSALRISAATDASLVVAFDGGALARAAADRMERTISDLERYCGLTRDSISAFILHQPNPRLVETMRRRANIPIEKIPLISKTCGNLGSSTCGVALCMAMDAHALKPRSDRGPMLMAAVGPGMLWGGTVLT